MDQELTRYLDKKFEEINNRFGKRDLRLFNIEEDLKGARQERQIIEKRVNDTYNAVDGFIKIVNKLD